MLDPAERLGTGRESPRHSATPQRPAESRREAFGPLGGSQPSTGFHGSFLGPLWRSLGPGFLRALLRAARWGLGGLEGGGIEAGPQAGATAPSQGSLSPVKVNITSSRHLTSPFASLRQSK